MTSDVSFVAEFLPTNILVCSPNLNQLFVCKMKKISPEQKYFMQVKTWNLQVDYINLLRISLYFNPYI